MLYNLYRPTDFSEVKGQEDVLVTMKRQSQTGKFGHAYLLAGHRGTGKTTIARILSRAINCENPSEKYVKAVWMQKTVWTSRSWMLLPITA